MTTGMLEDTDNKSEPNNYEDDNSYNKSTETLHSMQFVIWDCI